MTVLHDDPYRVLGVARDADQAAIRRAYRALAKKFHPDLNPGDTAAEDRFKQISLAYDILGDADKRARFDRGEIGPDGAERAGFDPRGFTQGGGFTQNGGFTQGGGFQGARGAAGDGPFTFRWSRSGQADGPGGGADFADIFADLFGGARGGGSGFDATGRGRPAKGADLRARLTVSFEEAALGAQKHLRLGAGKPLKVTIPAGIEDGHVLRLKGKGRPGPAGAPPGDALVEVAIAPHPRFRRDGLDVQVDVSVPLADAVLGGKVTVPTPSGPVALTVPPNSSSGRKLRLKGRGVHKGHHRGDLYARLMIALPEAPDPALVSAIRGWARRS